MDTVFAALISGGWATAIAGIGFWYNRASLRSVNRNALNTLDADHAARLWEKRAEVYIDMIRAVEARRVVRSADINLMSGVAPREEKVQEWEAEISESFWRTLESRLMAFASPEVLEALREDNKVNRRFFDLLKEAKNIPPESVSNREEFIYADIDATFVDDRLVALVQTDLHRKPSEWAQRAPVSREPHAKSQ
jgi:hypothetical protein